MLHVVADLVCDYVGSGKVAGRVELPLHVAVEGQIDVHPLIAGTIEGTDCRIGPATSGLNLAAEQPQDGFLVRPAHLLELNVPHSLRIAKNDLGKVSELFFIVGMPHRARRLDHGRPAGAASATQERPQINPKNEAEYDNDQAANSAADRQPAAASEATRAATAVAHVFDVGAFFASFPLHGASPGGNQTGARSPDYLADGCGSPSVAFGGLFRIAL